ncbi:hypothetical protein NA56DRAFT_700939 [Hyaloscypha hepaticicola]|uniref:Uncharacterized protein n=1 Tax=Hyaloscypha hepaticicola TaxID=2082293 RepID=A0A2J6QBD8_9HELO|nr:hypothetical protein NA56DRAFT_700939 [Hyaloscypha hepaticicola]
MPMVDAITSHIAQLNSTLIFLSYQHISTMLFFSKAINAFLGPTCPPIIPPPTYLPQPTGSRPPPPPPSPTAQPPIQPVPPSLKFPPSKPARNKQAKQSKHERSQTDN